jgi:hypothetical protein
MYCQVCHLMKEAHTHDWNELYPDHDIDEIEDYVNGDAGEEE